MRPLPICLVLIASACTALPQEASGVYTKAGVSPEQARAATLACDAAGKKKYPSKPGETPFMRLEAASASYQCMSAQGYVKVK